MPANRRTQERRDRTRRPGLRLAGPWPGRLRLALAIPLLACFLLLFLAPLGPEAREVLATLASVQLVPALLAGAVGIVAVLVLLTIVFGRVYCSVLCPLGLLQDALARLASLPGLRARRRARQFAGARPVLRNGVLLAFLLLLVLGQPTLFSWVEPYSLFGRLAGQAERLVPHEHELPAAPGPGLPAAPVPEGLTPAATQALPEVPETGRAAGPTPAQPADSLSALLPVLPLAALLVFLLVTALQGRRSWCNTVCPVGTFLGWLGRHALVRVRLEKERCVGCRACERVCKASCLDVRGQSLDASRCLACFNCLAACRHDALHLAAMPHARPDSRETATDGRSGDDSAEARRAPGRPQRPSLS